jgi:chemotaxis protein CheD
LISSRPGISLFRLWNNNPKSLRLTTTIGACTTTQPTACITTASPTWEEVRVDMAGMKVESKPVELVTSVGSCVAICLHDTTNKCGGLAHIMLPNSTVFPHELLPYKFADTAVPALVKAIRRLNVKEVPLFAKIAGGANMFPNMRSDTLSIGEKNIEAVKSALAANKVRLLGEDVGGSSGRRISFNVITGVATVRRFQGEIKTL